MKKNIFLQTIIFSLVIFLASCSHGLTDKKSKTKGDQKSYIVINLATDVSRMAQGNLFPSSRVQDLTNIVLKGQLGDAGAEQTLAEPSTITDLTGSPIQLDPGSWNFTLTAKLDGINFESTLTKVEVAAGTNTDVSFDLQPASSVTKGGLDITVNFPDTATKVNVEFKQLPSGTPQTFEYTADGTYKILTDANNKKYINYAEALSSDGSTTGLEQGTYSLTFTFYSSDITESLNTITVYATVLKGFTTSSTVEVASLNEVYNITYKAYKTESDKPAGVTSQDDLSPLVSGGQTWTNKYTRKSATVNLPALTLAGYHFDGWYDENDNKIESWSQRTGDLTLYAKWSSASVGVTVTSPEDITLTKTGLNENGICVFTATTTTDPATYAWYVDGVKDTNATGNTFTFNKIGKAKGIYVITVECNGYSVSDTISANGLIGSKSSPDAIGDIVFNDGSAIAYTDGLNFSDELKNAAVAVIFYTGTACSNDSNERMLGVGLIVYDYEEGSPKYTWATNDAAGYANLSGIQCTPSDTGVNAALSATFSGDKDGSDNWDYICSIDPSASANAQTKYTLFNYVNNYATNNGLTGSYASGWYLPSIAELCCLCLNKATIFSAFSALEKQINTWGTYNSSSQKADDGERYWALSISDSNICDYPKYQDINSIVCIRAF